MPKRLTSRRIYAIIILLLGKERTSHDRFRKATRGSRDLCNHHHIRDPYGTAHRGLRKPLSRLLAEQMSDMPRPEGTARHRRALCRFSHSSPLPLGKEALRFDPARRRARTAESDRPQNENFIIKSLPFYNNRNIALHRHIGILLY